jgi:hypothetical protein
LTTPSPDKIVIRANFFSFAPQSPPVHFDERRSLTPVNTAFENGASGPERLAIKNASRSSEGAAHKSGVRGCNP